MKTLAEKTTWLLNHTSYNVTRAWYEVNPARTAAIYDREYKKYLRITLNKRKNEVIESNRAAHQEQSEWIAKKCFELFGKKASELTLYEKKVMFQESIELV
ncbi:hypothetical protein IAE51_11795 [Lactococcus sp. S64]|uniref:hypothetical protein n=1 Tax=Lactococcus sp. S64 TaxID=2767459 RepID=UPI00190479D9|nr:hypothetical protein [Lactococcus sp. S64]MBK0084573.1 hypothetical protein [Lactococcus sp. S64]